MVWVVVVLIALLATALYVYHRNKARQARALADARAEAQRWYERLGGQLMNLSGDAPAVRQALADASERYTAAGAELRRATTVRQYELARETALEGLAYVRAARVALGLDPGPELPALAGQRAAGTLTGERVVEVEGHTYQASPHPSDATPYYHPGGRVNGRWLPAGWYSEPWWKTALVAGAAGLGSMMIFNALFPPAWGDGGYQAGYEAGLDYAHDHGWEPSGGDAVAADYAGGDFAGDFGDGDFGGDFGGDFAI